MERNNEETAANADSKTTSICLNPIVEPQNAENNFSVNESSDGLVASRDDVVDPNRPRAPPSITLWCLILLVHPILSHVFDLVSDIRLAVEYFENEKSVECSLTLAFTALQAIASAWISFLMHPKLGEKSSEMKDEKANENCLKKTAKLIAHYTMVVIFARTLPFCHLRKLYYAWRARKSQQKKDTVNLDRFYRKMLEEDRDSAVLEIIDCFLQSAPQLILQLYILLSEDAAISATLWSKIVSSCMTLFAFGKAMKEYHCAIRLAQPDKAVISEIGGVFILLWHLGTIAARILVITISASNWLSYTTLACVINWMVWTTWIYAKENALSVLDGKKTESSNDSQTATGKIRNLLLAGVLAVVYTYTFVNLGTGRTFVRNSIYYILCLLQNGTVVAIWFTLTSLTDESVWFTKDLLILSVVLFIIGIAAMITYYTLFHPTLQSSCQFDASECLTWV